MSSLISYSTDLRYDLRINVVYPGSFTLLDFLEGLKLLMLHEEQTWKVTLFTLDVYICVRCHNIHLYVKGNVYIKKNL